MAITLVGVGTSTEKAAGSGTVAVPYPASGIQANDVGVLCAGGNSATLMTNPATWNIIKSMASTGDTAIPWLYMGYKFLAGTESGTTLTVTEATAAASHQIIVLRGVDLTTPLDVPFQFFDKTTTTDALVPVPTMTTTKPGCALVYCGIQNGGSGGMTPPTTPANTWTNDFVWGAGRIFGDGHLVWSGSGATGTMTITGNGTTRGEGIIQAFRPAVTAGLPGGHVYTTDQATYRSHNW